MRSNTTENRYHVAHPDYGLIGAYPTRAEAFAAGDRWDDPERTGYTPHAATVWDNMAKKRYPATMATLPLVARPARAV